jgi:hypothetical protein
VPQLVARGHHVFASTTRTEKIADLRTLGAEALVMDGLDPASVGEAVARTMPNVIVHQTSAEAGTDDLKHFDNTFATTSELRTKRHRPPARRRGSGRRPAVCRPELRAVPAVIKGKRKSVVRERTLAWASVQECPWLSRPCRE